MIAVKIKIICIGKLKEKYLKDGISEFLKRLKVYAKVEIIEVDETKICDNPSDSEIKNVIEDEAKKIEKYLQTSDYVITLDVKGKTINNMEYVKMIDNACLNGYSSFSFIIGGSYGISNRLVDLSNFNWSFSKLTFTHQMIRLLLIEQIYRGFKIMKNEPYHK
ncbi:23S rRNA (pseudouridine1915-N3)-methyltransferase [Bacilli bacterium PM5-3]|nr:23S rRNA (pseudouridine1915-N3)-methyltransferase [Bacilli bacterium PM5-3]MDH6603382.1 23S rRNA (pseudouridine1915-N3)-methyltransferase [Bacilli bacterium PM5-9]